MKKYILFSFIIILGASLFGRGIYPTEFIMDGDSFFSVGRKDGNVRTFSRDFSSSRILGYVGETLTGLAIDGERLIVTAGEGVGFIYVVDKKTGKKLKTVELGHNLLSPVLYEDRLLVCDRFRNQIHILNKNTLALIVTVDTVREPVAMDVSDSGIAVVAGHMPEGSATDDNISAFVGLIDVVAGKQIKKIPLQPGGGSSRSVVISRDQKWAVLSHILARFQVPTTQIDRGWINTNAITLINLDTQEYYTTVLLDSVDSGAGNPFGLEFDSTGKTLYVALSGTNEVMAINFDALLEKLSNERKLDLVSQRLSYLSSFSKRNRVEGKGPREMVITDEFVYVLSYYSENVERLVRHDLILLFRENLSLVSGSTNLEDMPDVSKAPLAEWGEYVFNSADICFQKWQSCVSCHPDGRADGLNWDLMNDGIGNPKQTKSMLYSHQTAPAMITGIRKNAEVAVRAGFRAILFVKRPEEESIAIDAYLSGMKPVPSPYLAKDGKLTAQQVRGKALATQAGCLSCHSGTYYTDNKLYQFDLGSDREKNRAFETPTLIEIWRTAPYMYDGRYFSLFEMLLESRESGRHGDVKDFSDKDLKAIEAWVLTL